MTIKKSDLASSSEDHFGRWIDLSSIELADGSGDDAQHSTWVQALPYTTFHHPKHGKVSIDQDRVNRFVENFKSGIRGTELDIDYDHKIDPAQGRKAAGWVKDVQANDDGLFLKVEFTDSAAQGIKNKEWKYFSPEFLFEWLAPNGKKYKDVLAGGALTNRPFLKGMLPINLSEVVKEGESMDELLASLREMLQLGEDATQEQIMSELATKLAEPPAPKDDPPNDDPPKQKTTEEPPKGKQSEPAEPAKLSELAKEHPEVQELLQLTQTLTNRVSGLEASNRQSEATVKLTEWNSAEYSGYAFPAKLHDNITALLSEVDDETRTKLHEVLGGIAKDGLVELGERPKAPKGQGNHQDALATLNEKVAEKQKAGLDYADAVSAVMSENPELYDAVQMQMAEEG